MFKLLYLQFHMIYYVIITKKSPESDNQKLAGHGSLDSMYSGLFGILWAVVILVVQLQFKNHRHNTKLVYRMIPS